MKNKSFGQSEYCSTIYDKLPLYHLVVLMWWNSIPGIHLHLTELHVCCARHCVCYLIWNTDPTNICKYIQFYFKIIHSSSNPPLRNENILHGWHEFPVQLTSLMCAKHSLYPCPRDNLHARDITGDTQCVYTTCQVFFYLFLLHKMCYLDLQRLVL